MDETNSDNPPTDRQEFDEWIYGLKEIPTDLGPSEAARKYSQRIGVEVCPEWATPEGGTCGKPFCSDTEPEVARVAYEAFNVGVTWERRRLRLLNSVKPENK